jgi:hypothetical protein
MAMKIANGANIMNRPSNDCDTNGFVALNVIQLFSKYIFALDLQKHTFTMAQMIWSINCLLTNL